MTGAHLRYFVTDALDEWRHSPGPNVLAAATLAAVLFVAGVNLLLLTNLSARVAGWKSDLRLSIYLADGASASDVETLRAKVQGVAGVEKIEYVDKDEALARFRKSFKDLADVPTELGTNPLPASLEVYLGGGAQAKVTAQNIGSAASGSKAVEEVRYDQAFLDKVDSLLDVARWGGSALGLVILAAVGFVVAGVLRLTVHARRDEIEIMHLVGAPPMLVRGPFLVTGLVHGLAGAALAIFAVEAARRAATLYTAGDGLFGIVAGRPLALAPAALLVGTGALLGLASAWLACSYQSKAM
ncbi:MAG TPA: permease-like cell division protein FtsX [Candidatus Polarisedimenticolaceae bacterium]|nr:permease-like cell division protein FtsX [Candidatus Polarisedimenticolaceae bacterium]